MTNDQETIQELFIALVAAKDHLEFIRWGDKFGRACALEDQLPKRIDGALARAKKGKGQGPMNQTAQEAFDCVSRARIGSLAGRPTTEYLIELSKQLILWQREVESEISSAARREEYTPRTDIASSVGARHYDPLLKKWK